MTWQLRSETPEDIRPIRELNTLVFGQADEAELAARLRVPFSGPAFMDLELVAEALMDFEGDVRYPTAFGLDT